MDAQSQRDQVSKYYGETLKSAADLKTSACCPVDAVPKAHRSIIDKLHPEVVSRFYGCGSPIPQLLDGAVVLDLGCGTGRDAFLASALVGPTGSVIGVDMTEAQLEVARSHRAFHAEAFFGSGAKSNVEFHRALIEDLAAADIADNSVDVVISNCVCNLCPNKEKVFAEVFRVLKHGGEFYFSDVYADRRLTEEARANPVLVSECLGGALYVEDFRRVMAKVGFSDVRIVTAAPIDLQDEALLPLVAGVKFLSVTTRCFKSSGLEDCREDYGQIAVYKPLGGGCSPFRFDVDFSFSPNKEISIDRNTAQLIQASRFSEHFSITPPSSHRGMFVIHDLADTSNEALTNFCTLRTLKKAFSNVEESNGCGNYSAESKSPGCPPMSKAVQKKCC